MSWTDSSIEDCSGWYIAYRYKPDNCERMKRSAIKEEELFDTEQEALLAQFEDYKDSVKRKLEYFKKAANRLGMNDTFSLEYKKG